MEGGYRLDGVPTVAVVALLMWRSADPHPQISRCITVERHIIDNATEKMYLRLYHGRTDPAQQMDDWGFVGPTFGPLACYMHTYCCTFRVIGEDRNSEIWLETHDDMIRWVDSYYGDMEVFIAAAEDRA